MDELELEQAMRDGLHRRAEGVDTTAPVVARARAARRRRRRGRVAIGLAAASVVAVVGTSVVLSGGDDPGEASRAGNGADPLPTEWRTEYWHDTAVDVPADWAWGGSPMTDRSGSYSCWAGPMRGVEGKGGQRGDSGTGYVGRPMILTDMCLGFDPADQRIPDAPYVWFDAPLDPGTVDLGDGWVQETVDVNGSLVTVAADDEELRRRIVESAGDGETCMSEVDAEATQGIFPQTFAGDSADIETMTVCAYRTTVETGAKRPAHLTYVTTVGRAGTREYLDALSQGEPERDQCPTANYSESEWVVLELTDSHGGTVRRDVVHFLCAGVDLGAEGLKGFETIRLTTAMTRPWAVSGIPLYVGYFRGPRG